MWLRPHVVHSTGPRHTAAAEHCMALDFLVLLILLCLSMAQANMALHSTCAKFASFSIKGKERKKQNNPHSFKDILYLCKNNNLHVKCLTIIHI